MDDTLNSLTERVTRKVTRVEVIDENGRVLVKHDVSVVLSLQDDDRTLKMFVVQRDKILQGS